MQKIQQCIVVLLHTITMHEHVTIHACSVYYSQWPQAANKVYAATPPPTTHVYNCVQHLSIEYTDNAPVWRMYTTAYNISA